jgi:hypothetical protein
MSCDDTTDRITEICTELLEIIDDSRAHCVSDECELINCVVHDSVKNIQRALTQIDPRGPTSIRPDLGGVPRRSRRLVN